MRKPWSKLSSFGPFRRSYLPFSLPRQYHFNETNDAVAVAKLLQAYEPYDSAAMAEVITLPTFRNLETEVSCISFINGV